MEWIRRTLSITMLLNGITFNLWRDNFKQVLKQNDWLVNQYFNGQEQISHGKSITDVAKREQLPINEIITQSTGIVFTYIVMHHPWTKNDHVFNLFPSVMDRVVDLKGHKYLTLSVMPHVDCEKDILEGKGFLGLTVNSLKSYYESSEFCTAVADGQLCSPTGRPVSQTWPRLAESDVPVMVGLTNLAYLCRTVLRWPTPTGLITSVRLYGLLGAPDVAEEFSRILDVKYIQYDSLGYLFLWKTIYSSLKSRNLKLLTSAEIFYSTYRREVSFSLVKFCFPSFQFVTLGLISLYLIFSTLNSW